MKPSKTSKNQKIEYGLESAVRVRSYTTNKTDQSGGTSTGTSRRNYSHLYMLEDESSATSKDYDQGSTTDRSHITTSYAVNNHEEESQTLFIPPSSAPSNDLGCSSQLPSPRKKVQPRTNTYSSQFPVRPHAKTATSGGFKFHQNVSPPITSTPSTPVTPNHNHSKKLPVLVNHQNNKKRVTKKLTQAPPLIPTHHTTIFSGLLNRDSRFPFIQEKNLNDNRAQSAVPGSYFISPHNSRPSTQQNAQDEKDTHIVKKMFKSRSSVNTIQVTGVEKHPEKRQQSKKTAPLDASSASPFMFQSPLWNSIERFNTSSRVSSKQGNWIN
ncbi:hypothetical protein AKO1_010006 [Acrasis kona]|uniref:Uncharacterized protein n=1 Tax=Acrasis kona TaxID=1008807 RepID=A0AAW2ZQB9_9EUKA